MSLFGKIFGGKKQEVAPSTQDAIQKLRETEEMLIKKQDFLEKKIKDVSLSLEFLVQPLICLQKSCGNSFSFFFPWLISLSRTPRV
ncbi:unnamed protein product [Heligmosomoides polygyrus]|uniref:BAR domain-containing protein n=1 Tax=Heligmosomoides polygyrus TaxID=6339 RepID=A0A183GPY0_HELPZ|nr:unnamed protein product [Heligmosomoides polygyrus]